MSRINTHQYSVEEAFRECFFVVPDYQREYVWTDKEVTQLLDDINDEIDSTSEYFIGTVLVSKKEEKTHYEVIDGQQRLTTLFLLLCALRNRFQGEPEHQTLSGLIATSYISVTGDTKRSLRLEPRYESASEVMTKIVEIAADPKTTRSGIEASGIKPFGSLENLLNAYSTIDRYLQDNYEDKTALKKYLGYLVNKVIFIQISTDVSSALKIFETINERGIGLNPMDLLKNLLFTQVREEEFSKLKDEWKKITKPLEENKEKPLRFLRYFLMANYKIDNARRDSIVREDEIYRWLTDKKNAALCNYQNDPFVFVRKIAKNVDQFIAYSDGRGNDGKTNIAMDNLKALSGQGFSLHFVLLLAATNLPKNLFDHFVRQLESFLFYYIFTKSPTKDLERSFSVWADELRALSGEPDSNKQKQRLNEFIADHFQASMNNKEAELADDLKRYSLNSMQRYRTRYLLAKLTQYVQMAYKGLKSAGSLADYVDLEIEHILPDTPRKELRVSFAQQYPDKDYDEYKNKLGNLTLLEKPINIVAGNNFFVDKKKAYVKCKYYLTSSIAEINVVGVNTSITRINQKLRSFDDWTPDSIDERQDLLIALAGDVWKTEPIV